MEYDKSYYAGKVAAVTGGASGIGFALVEELLESDASKVVLADFSVENLAAKTAELEERYPGKVKGILCNVTIEDEVKAMVESAAEFGEGRLDLLINCAGAGFQGKFAAEPDGIDPEKIFLKKVVTNEDWKAGLALNFFGPLYGCRHALPIMIKQGSGQIINIISGIAFAPMPYQSIYSASKSALCALSFGLRAEFAHLGIKISPATPGTTHTPLLESGGAAAAEGMGQTPHQSAQRILDGVAKNLRVITGDDDDEQSARSGFAPGELSRLKDTIGINSARKRRAGEISFGADEDLGIDRKKAREITALLETPLAEQETRVDKIAAYMKANGAEDIPAEYYAGKTAAVTGAASGIGLALCEKLLQCGAERVAMVDRSKEKLDAQVKRLSAEYPGKLQAIGCDISSEDDVKVMIAEAADFFGGKFDILINCAGIGNLGAFIDFSGFETADKAQLNEVLTPEMWDTIFSVNFYGALYGCRYVLPVMLARGEGQIINIISGNAYISMPYESSYSSTKAAELGLTLALRYEYWEDGIKFNPATPGTTATGIFDGGPIPDGAQTPEMSATRILAGAARNERTIMGDYNDVLVGIMYGNPKHLDRLDKITQDVAAERAGGNMGAYGINKSK